MPRATTALGGLEVQPEQFPISLVQFAIPSFFYNAIHDADLDAVYLNPSTNAVAMAPGTGLVQFVPYSGLAVPQLEMTEDKLMSEVTLTVANIRGDWGTVVAANQYRETLATIWQGNLVQPAGTNPFAITFQGAVTFWAGRIEDIQPNELSATITLSPHFTPFTTAWPYRTYSPPGFKHMPTPGSTLKWGFTYRDL